MATKQFKKLCDTHGEFTATGPRGTCPQCKEGDGSAGAPPAEKLKASRNGMIITLDLSRNLDLAMRIRDLAQQNYRTPELQVLYMLDQEYQREKGVK